MDQDCRLGLDRRGESPMKSRLSWVCLALAFGGLSGCATLGIGRSPDTKTPEQPMCTVRIQGSLGADRTYQQVVREGMTAQNILEESGQAARHGNFTIDILRQIDQPPGFVKMPVAYDSSKDRIPFESDYAIHPGDQVVIRPHTLSAFETIADSLSGKN
jgi:hypothetical protein